MPRRRRAAHHSGDIVQLGDYRLELVDEALVAQAAPGAAPTPALPPVHQRPNRLVVVVGPHARRRVPPATRSTSRSAGPRTPTSRINHSSVSRLHAELFALGNGRFEIVDKASANGIRINGVELKRGILEAGDALELGDVRLRFVGAGQDLPRRHDAAARGRAGASTWPVSRAALSRADASRSVPTRSSTI